MQNINEANIKFISKLLACDKSKTGMLYDIANQY